LRPFALALHFAAQDVGAGSYQQKCRYAQNTLWIDAGSRANRKPIMRETEC